jgi:hypothetical protein
MSKWVLFYESADNVRSKAPPHFPAHLARLQVLIRPCLAPTGRTHKVRWRAGYTPGRAGPRATAGPHAKKLSK